MTHQAAALATRCGGFFLELLKKFQIFISRAQAYLMTPERRHSLLFSLVFTGLFCAPVHSQANTGSTNTTNAIQILFVGNSFSFGRVDPVMTYNWREVSDLTAASSDAYPYDTHSYPTPHDSNYSYTNAEAIAGGYYEPHPWGGVPAIFKQLTMEMGLNYSVSHSLRGSATLKGQFLNMYATNGYWNTRGNATNQPWDVVILQENSSRPLPTNKSGDPQLFQLYAYEYQQLINKGLATNFSESQYITNGSTKIYSIPANPNANPNAKVYLEETWAYPQYVEKHYQTSGDDYTAAGEPVIKLNSSNKPYFETLYYTKARSTVKNLYAMTTDLRISYQKAYASNTNSSGSNNYAGIIPVGDAFQLAISTNIAKGSNFYTANYEYRADTASIDLWWHDRMHASVYGSYLSALTIFGKVTGIDPYNFGTNDQAAEELGISPTYAGKLQSVASKTLGYKH